MLAGREAGVGQTVPGATLAARGLGFVGDPPHPANK